MTPEERLDRLGIRLPPPPPAVGNYLAWVRAGDLIVTSGQLPWEEGEMRFAGRLGMELTVEQGRQAARLAAINAIAQLKQALGALSRVRRVARLEGNVHCAPGFREHPKVLDGASDLLVEVFGERGMHSRTALGIADMPLGAAVQLSLWAEAES